MLISIFIFLLKLYEVYPPKQNKFQNKTVSILISGPISNDVTLASHRLLKLNANNITINIFFMVTVVIT